MKLIRFCVLSLILLQASACSHFYASQDNLNQQIDEWLKAKQFAKIEDTLKYLSPGHPDYKTIKQRKKEIAEKKQDFINDTIARADTLLKEDKWQQALNIYQEAQKLLPDDTTLATRKSELIKERDTQVTELRKNMLLRRARALVQYQSIYEKLEKLIPHDYGARYDINRYKKEKQEIASELMECGEYSLDTNNYTLAAECIDLSNKLDASTEKKISLDSIRKKKKYIDDKRRSNELIDAYQKAYNSGDIPKARQHLEALIALDSHHKKARELKTQLDRDINRQIEKGITIGKTLYSQGQINEAVDIWEELLKVDPKNEELLSLVARGKKVSTKIKTLEKSTTKQPAKRN